MIYLYASVEEAYQACKVLWKVMKELVGKIKKSYSADEAQKLYIQKQRIKGRKIGMMLKSFNYGRIA